IMTTPTSNPPADKPSNPQRRHLLAGSAAALAAAGMGGIHRTAAAQASTAKPLPPYVAWKNPEAMIVHSTNTVETKRSAFGSSVITPSDQLYIRNNLPAPNESIVANRDAWRVAVEGVSKPRQRSVGVLTTIGLGPTAMVLQRSGNGRGMFPSKRRGTPWQVGAAGCVTWSGVPVRALVDALGGGSGG